MVHRLIYFSSTAPSFQAPDVEDILSVARERNRRAGITGLLVYHDGNFLQILEGPRDAVEECFTRIQNDPRHDGIIRVVSEDVEERVFGDWEMAWMPFQDASAEAQQGFLDIQSLRDSDTMQRAQRDFMSHAFVNTFLRSFRATS
ncbi:MAG: hypothetical protein C0606_03855 [Hyphomicrobiales bacterium]|nr:MAG: hypothetical protein C0606_03855 [Hyphomicrobiales bacterium]